MRGFESEDTSFATGCKSYLHLKAASETNIHIAATPCWWQVEFADDRRKPHWQSVLGESAKAGNEANRTGRRWFHARGTGFMDFEPQPEPLLGEVDEAILKIGFNPC